MQRRPLLKFAALWPLGAAAASTSSPLPLVYPRHQALNDPQQGYVTALLQLALARSGQAYAVRRSELRMVQTRAMQEIATASGSVDVVWAMTSREREMQLLPVRIPIDRGLIGWRVALIEARCAPCAASPAWRGCLPARCATGPTPPSCKRMACASTPRAPMKACSGNWRQGASITFPVP